MKLNQSLFYPKKICWSFPHDDRDLIDKVKSKSIKKFLANEKAIYDQLNITHQIDLCTKSEYLAWLTKYKERSIEQNHRIIADIKWYDERISQGKTIWFAKLFQNQKLIGQKVISQDLTNVIRSAFKYSYPIEGLHQNISSGLILDIITLHHFSNIKFKITGGKSQNLFNISNTVGYLNYKARIGYEPTVDDAEIVFEREIPVENNQSFLSFLTTSNSTTSTTQLFGFNLEGFASGELNETRKYFEITSYNDSLI